MNIIYLSSEVVPFAKTGGLADVCGALPAKVTALGHQAAVIMPAFNDIHDCGLRIQTTDTSFAIQMSDHKLIGARLLKSTIPNSDVPVWFIDQPQYFQRDGLYGSPTGDHPDNAERFAFFCRAAMQAITRAGWAVDIVHCNDWQTGLVPAMIKNAPPRHPWTQRAKSVFTIHNLAYQGQFPKSEFMWSGEPWSRFTPDQYEYYDQLNYLKTGIVTADQITTVSPRYAQEICTQQHGCGLDGVLKSAARPVVGIINGIDEDVWNPSTDQHLTMRYDRENWAEGKAANKQSLQEQFKMDINPDVPMIGLVGRLAEQKGWDLIVPVLRWHLTQDRPAQWMVLGSGDGGLEHELRELARQYPSRFGLHVGFSNELAHRIEAGSDLFVMPSHYEPCGLNQLYSLRYGTVPIVTQTGGLADTVTNCTQETLADQTATGFFLADPTAQGLDNAIGKALELRYHETEKWAQLIQTGMAQDWTWRRSAAQYADLYAETITLNG